MGAYEHFPYTNYQDVNIDWVLETTKRMDELANQLDTEISEEVDAQLQEMIDDGTLGDLINNTLLVNINNKVDDVKADVDAITPLDATPTDGSTKGVTSDGVYDAIKTVADDLDDLSNDVDALDTKVDGIVQPFIRAGKNIVFFGDSWTVGSGATDPATQRFTTLIATRFGMTEFNYGVGGAGFTRPNTIIAEINNANGSMSADDKNNTTVVLICAGVNDIRNMDSTTIADFIGAVVDAQERAKQVFPNALICMAVGNTMRTPYYDTPRHWIERAIIALRETNTAGKVLIIDHVGAAINGRSDTYASDNLHPNTYGHSLLAGFLANAMRGGSTDTNYYSATYTFNEVVSSVDTAPHVYRQTENVMITGGKITLAEAVSSNTVIGSYQGPFCRDNLYIPVYRSNAVVGSLAITTSGSVRLIPNSGVTMAIGWQLIISPICFLFNTYISA